ncbi:MAG TPA: DUF5696 domain-containing protein [Candidatus Limiplasma sp.]|nr:DUF5696 domain-containing protein [Candidatus Limiplasma sp.]HRX07715.1 DUF5696 domain-containing protein [Candidatus Limiplasma sp.]
MSKRGVSTKMQGAVLLHRRRLIRRVFLIALGAAALAVLVWFGYVMLHFQLYDGYRDVLDARAYITQAGTPFAAIGEDVTSVPGMALAAENESFKLYTDVKTAEVAVYDKRNGVTVYSNPPDLANDPIANKTNMNYLKSQFLLDYYNQSRTAGVYDSYSMALERGQVTAESIPGGIRYTYELGEIEEIEYYVPTALSPEKYEEIIGKVSPADGDTIRRMYTLDLETEGVYGLITTVRSNKRTLRSLDTILQSAGFTQEDYYEQMQRSAGGAAEPMTFVIALEYRLCDEGLEVKLPVSLMQEKGGGSIYRVQLLRTFGAAGADETGYIVVPDGAGAIIRFNNGKTNASAYSQYIYGIDMLEATYTILENTTPARLPIYGICRENSSVLATIERGASLCYLTADIAGKYNSYNYCYPTFMLRSYDILSMFGVSGMEAELPIVEKDLYDEDITVRYALLTEEHKGYTGLANYYRERLMREGTLTPQAAGGDIPLFYDVIGAVKSTAHFLGFRYLQVKPMTTFAQAGAMAEALQALGVQNQIVNFQGWMNGGYYHDVPDRVSVLSQLGGKQGLEALSARLDALGGTLYADVAFQNVTLISKRYNRAYESSRYYGAGYTAVLGQINPALLRRVSALGYPETMSSLLSPKFLSRYVDGFLRSADSLDIAGYSLRDLGDELHSDKRRTEVISREQAMAIVTAQLAKLNGTGKELLLSGGNAYALPYAAAVTGAPLSASEFYLVDESVPLYPMIVHGCVDYAGAPINMAESADWQDEILQMIEYGASCRFVFTWEDAAEMKYTGLNRYYATTFANWQLEAADVYRQLNTALAPVHGVQMISHERAGDVAKVGYANGVTLYLNYGAEETVFDSVLIPARGWTLEGVSP